MNLYPYQEVGAQFLASRRRALLADEMGLGKSAQAIAAAAAVTGDFLISTIAVICPASVKENWRREFARFWPASKNCRLLIESYDKVVRGALNSESPDVLILDEIHYCKSKEAKRTKKILGKGGLAERARYVFALTGTPTPNHNGELWPLLVALAPETIKTPKTNGTMSYWSFVHRYCKTFDNGFGLQIVGNKNTDELRQRVAPFILRRKKDEVMKNLPPIRFDTLPLTSEAAVRAIKHIDKSGEIEKVEAALREGPEALAKIAPHVATLRRVTGLAKAPLVAEWVKDWLEAGGSKIVIFAHHRDVIKHLQDALEDVAVVLTGDMGVWPRQAAVDAFQTDPVAKVFIGQIQAAGTGITLTAASDVLFAESSWVPAENSQAAMRVHRIGQKNACLVRFATLAGSIDERIQAVVSRKMFDIAQLFG